MSTGESLYGRPELLKRLFGTQAILSPLLQRSCKEEFDRLKKRPKIRKRNPCIWKRNTWICKRRTRTWWRKIIFYRLKMNVWKRKWQRQASAWSYCQNFFLCKDFEVAELATRKLLRSPKLFVPKEIHKIFLNVTIYSCFFLQKKTRITDQIQY